MDRPVWPLGLTCERTTLDFWSEPLNALTNIACIIAVIVCWRERQRVAARDPASLIHILFIAALGLTSFLMHTMPTKPLSVVDTIMTASFIVFALFGLLTRHLRLGVFISLLFVAAFLSLAPFVSNLAEGFTSRSTALFIPVLFFFPICSALMIFRAENLPSAERDQQNACARLVMISSVTFILGLGARALDQPFCSRVPTGLHFLWHIAFAVTMGLITIAYIRNAPRRA
jgi:hypothetical protein